MDFYLLSPDGNDLHFPVNPSEINVKSSSQLETVNIISIGEVDFPKGDKRTEIMFSSFFPAYFDSYCQYVDIPDPQDALAKLIQYRLKKKPLRLLVTESPINTLVLITDVQYIPSKGGEPGDVYFDINMRTWKEIKVRTTVDNPIVNVIGANTPNPREDTKPVPKIYIVKKDDNLTKIAKLELGKMSRWKDIYENNKTLIGSDPNLILPGQKLVMPA